MVKEFKSSSTQFNTFIGIAIFAFLATIIIYLLLNVVIMMLPVFTVLWAVFAFWGKDRVLITMHEDYIEAKEAIAAKKKLIRYKDIDRVEEHKTAKQITIFLKGEGNKKERIGINALEKLERKEFIQLLEQKIAA